MTWVVGSDCMPNWMYTVYNRETGETLKTDKAPGWFRTTSEKKAQKVADKLNKKGRL